MQEGMTMIERTDEREGPAAARAYARVMELGTWGGLALLVVMYAAYVGGVVAPRVPLEELPRYWSLGAGAYRRATGAPDGWRWVADLGHGESLNVLGVALLASVAALCYLRILPILLRGRDYAYAAIAVAEVVLIALAASGAAGGPH
jgi:hypothetical protein